jgi:UPF0755 protein
MNEKQKTFNLFISLLLALIVIYVATLVYLPSNKSLEAKIITIEKGQTSKETSLELKNNGLISSSNAFYFYSILTNNFRKIQAGDYLISSQMSVHQILKIMTNGEISKQTITLIEGWDLEEIGDYLETKQICTKQEFIDSANNKKWTEEFSFLKDKPEELSLEGYIFPDTYYINMKASADDIIELVLKEFESKLTDQMINDIKKQNKTIFEIITMASMIEKEVRTIDDKKIVSGVLNKRLDIGMALQVDATVLYAMNQEKETVYIKDTKIDSPYNTYKYRGLPLGPISNPGTDSINAAIYPTKTNYLYYLSTKDGKTIFSRTLEEHNIAKAKYLK